MRGKGEEIKKTDSATGLKRRPSLLTGFNFNFNRNVSRRRERARLKRANRGSALLFAHGLPDHGAIFIVSKRYRRWMINVTNDRRAIDRCSRGTFTPTHDTGKRPHLSWFLQLPRNRTGNKSAESVSEKWRAIVYLRDSYLVSTLRSDAAELSFRDASLRNPIELVCTGR